MNRILRLNYKTSQNNNEFKLRYRDGEEYAILEVINTEGATYIPEEYFSEQDLTGFINTLILIRGEMQGG